MTDLVSIVMPCHNGGKYLDESIESVLQQTYNNWELLIIDDNSTDSSKEIIENYSKKDIRVKYLKNPNPICMPSAPRNVGIENANGRFIAFLDCDDKWLPSKLENQLRLFDEKTSVVFSFYQKMDVNSCVNPKIVQSPDFVYYKKLLKGDCIGNLTGIYDTAKTGKIYQKNVHAEDYLMWLEILQKGFYARNTSTVEAFYRITTNSLSSNKLNALRWTWNIYRKELKFSYLVSIFYFFIYAIKGFLKYIK